MKRRNTYPPEERRECADCVHLQAFGWISWWCTNQEAVEARGTSIPGCCLCRYWAPKIKSYPRLRVGRGIGLWAQLKAFLTRRQNRGQ